MRWNTQKIPLIAFHFFHGIRALDLNSTAFHHCPLSSSSISIMAAPIGTVNTQENTASGVNLVSSIPLFLHASDAPGMNLVNNIFDGRGYQGWRRSILIALSAKTKLGFINGSCSEPAANATGYSLWHRCNDMVTSWLLNSLSKDITPSVIYSRTAKDLWTDLEQRFGQSNSAKLYHLACPTTCRSVHHSILADTSPLRRSSCYSYSLQLCIPRKDQVCRAWLSFREATVSFRSYLPLFCSIIILVGRSVH